MKKIVNEKGITLVALVITIVILLILAGISISALTNTNIFEKAEEAKSKSEAAEIEQNQILDSYESEINQYLSGQSGEKLVDKVPTTSTIALSGYNGYNNAVKLLDDTCSTLYNNLKLASKVQNLKIEDITSHMKTQPTEDPTEYTPTNINNPKILEQEENQTVEKSTTGNKLKLSEQNEFVTGKATSATSTLKRTYWNKSMTSEDFNSKYYELFINNGSNYSIYWMSSRCVNANSNYANFNVRSVYSGSVYANFLYDSNDNGHPNAFAFRPLITLNANVQIDTANSGDGSKADSGYAIK